MGDYQSSRFRWAYPGTRGQENTRGNQPYAGQPSRIPRPIHPVTNPQSNAMPNESIPNLIPQNQFEIPNWEIRDRATPGAQIYYELTETGTRRNVMIECHWNKPGTYNLTLEHQGDLITNIPARHLRVLQSSIQLVQDVASSPSPPNLVFPSVPPPLVTMPPFGTMPPYF